MVQQRLISHAVTKDAPTNPEKEEYVGDMGQFPKPAVMKDAPTMSR
eukprot:CAMPEP_0201876132 /NCGR_PEP_ID=MMETSP0902-20130614/7908_1 /ASSEMBLY_ACC=CAM_ASM_000551 /TAXON_ID=420261 /ORGANISM="Thalassiosira antarctica, Strain CCMP982" /LENGTH=45 /DNA_ID= /DNA_START= /DNA_END= /DNA_ORIENTATION=